MLLTNKHVIAAMIVAPILVIIAYFGVDYMVSERPHNAVAGNSYPLVAKSNCRYQSGKCTFENGDIEITLSAKQSDNDSMIIQLSSELPLTGAKIALATNSDDLPPHNMQPSGENKSQWETTLQNRDIENARLLLVVSVNDSLYYGETETSFTDYKTGFSNANMH
jgi:hypothetical protein